MKRILYDMGLLTHVRWLLQRAFNFEPPFGPGSQLKRVPPPKNFKKISVSLNHNYAKSSVFSPCCCFFFLSGKSGIADPPPPFIEPFPLFNDYFYHFLLIFALRTDFPTPSLPNRQCQHIIGYPLPPSAASAF